MPSITMPGHGHDPNSYYPGKTMKRSAISVRTRRARATSKRERAWLRPNINWTGYTVTALKQMLANNGVKFPSRAQKSHLIQLTQKAGVTP